MGERLVRSQAAPRSADAVTTTMIAVTPSMRRFVGMSIASSINLPRMERSPTQAPLSTMIPPFGTPAAGRMFPKPWSFTDLGLARPLVEHWQPTSGLDPIAVGLGIPKNLGKGISNAAADVKSFGNTVAKAIAESNETPEDKARKAHRAEEAAIALEAAQVVEAAKAEQQARVDAIVADGVQRALERQRIADEKRARRKRMRARHRASEK